MWEQTSQADLGGDEGLFGHDGEVNLIAVWFGEKCGVKMRKSKPEAVGVQRRVL